VPWWTGADAQLVRRYRKADGYLVDVYVGYFTIQQQDKEIANFRSADLHRRARRLSIPLPEGGPLVANLVDPVNARTQALLFWYDIDGAEETSQYRAKMRTLWNILVSGRSNGAVVALVAQAEATQSDSAARLQELAGLLHVALAQRLPRPHDVRVGRTARAGTYATDLRR
jgi:EpsI family protein